MRAKAPFEVRMATRHPRERREMGCVRQVQQMRVMEGEADED